MLDIALAAPVDPQKEIVGVLALPVTKPEGAAVATPAVALSDELGAEVAAFLEQCAHSGEPGEAKILPRPLRGTSKIIFFGVGDRDEGSWRSAGAALARVAAKETSVTVDLGTPPDPSAAVRGFSEGAWLADYRFRLEKPADRDTPRLARLELRVGGADPMALPSARAVAEHTCFARDLTNMPSVVKTPEWFVDRVRALADGIDVKVWLPEDLEAEGFNGILAVGGGSTRSPRLLQLDWAPAGAGRHVVLVGKGITFDTGGNDIKPADMMTLMRKDMGGGAAVVGATLAAAQLRLPVRVTTLVPLAENMVSGSAWRQGDVVRHYGGLTSEVRSTDAEGRVVLGDAIAYAAHTYDPDYLIDLATLTGASRVALGKKIAALFSDDDDLVKALTEAAAAAGEAVWQLPLPSDYMPAVVSDIADLYNATDGGQAGTITAALYLREFAGPLRDRWAHIDMSSPAWSDSDSGELCKGATGWGVRTLVRWLSTL